MNDGNAQAIANELRTMNRHLQDIVNALRNIRDKQR